MSVVTAARYNTLQTKVSNVLGTGSSDKGYGVTVTSGQVAAGDVVTASHLTLVHADINKCILHQTASATSAIVSLSAGDIIEETNATTKKGWAQYEAEGTAAETNRLNAAAGNFATATEATETRSSAWGGSTDTINTTYTVTFSSADPKRQYFNAGGEIRMVLSVSGGSGTKYTSWSTLFGDAGTIKYGRTATTSTGNGDETTIGNVDMTGSAQQVFQHDVGGGGVYAENDFFVTCRDSSSTVLEFIVTCFDEDAGDQTGTGAAVDEDVSGSTVLTVTSYYPNNASAVQHSRPVFAVTDNFN